MTKIEQVNNEEGKKIVDINGVKMEIDMRNVKVISNFKCGDKIKVLLKDYSQYKSYPGVIIGFDDFKELPSILIAYLKDEYGSAEVEFLTYNKKSENIEICQQNGMERTFSKQDAFSKIERKIDEKQKELDILIQKKKYFESNFNQHFTD